jgi:hypothetical protein
MTPPETANLVPTFIENTLRSVFRPIAAHKPLSRRQFDTCVLFFYIFISVNAVISNDRITPDKDAYPEYPKNVASPSRRWDIALEAAGSRVPPFSKASRACPVSMRRQPHHGKIKET